MTAWFEYWIENIKGDSIRPNTIRNYKERFQHNIKKCIGNMVLSDVKPMHCQNSFVEKANRLKTLPMMQHYLNYVIKQTLIDFRCTYCDTHLRPDVSRAECDQKPYKSFLDILMLVLQ